VELRQQKPKRWRVEERAEAGDLWDHTAIAADRKLLVSLVVGTRTQAQTTALVHAATQRRRPGHLPAIFTDAQSTQGPEDLGLFHSDAVPPLDALALGGVVQFLSRSQELADQVRGAGLASDPSHGSQMSRPYLVDLRVVTLPCLGGLRLSQDTTRDKFLSFQNQ
jgi:hypothetical protein